MSKFLSVFSSTLSTVHNFAVIAIVATGIVAVADTVGLRAHVADNNTNIQLPVSITQSQESAENTDRS